MELQGKIIEIFKTNAVSDKFQKREFVLEIAENPKYPELIKMEMIQDKCEHLDGYKIGDMVDVSVNLKGREWTDPKTDEVKYFNTLQAWRMQKVAQSSHNSQSQESQVNNDYSEKGDDLPF